MLNNIPRDSQCLAAVNVICILNVWDRVPHIVGCMGRLCLKGVLFCAGSMHYWVHGT